MFRYLSDVPKGEEAGISTQHLQILLSQLHFHNVLFPFEKRNRPLHHPEFYCGALSQELKSSHVSNDKGRIPKQMLLKEFPCRAKQRVFGQEVLMTQCLDLIQVTNHGKAMCLIYLSSHQNSVVSYFSQKNILKSESFKQKVNMSWLIAVTKGTGLTIGIIWWTFSNN